MPAGAINKIPEKTQKLTEILNGPFSLECHFSLIFCLPFRRGGTIKNPMAKDPLSQDKMDHLLGQAEELLEGTDEIDTGDSGIEEDLLSSQAEEEQGFDSSMEGVLEGGKEGMEINIDPGEEGSLKIGDIVKLKNQPGQVNMLDVILPELKKTAGGNDKVEANMNLLMDVQMTLTVELGRTKMFVKEILGLGEGSIIELDKLAGEPVDLLVNGKLVAKGEVVVIDENFGVRVTDIVTSVARLELENKDVD